MDHRLALTAGAIGGLLGGIPSTVHALARGRDPLEATYAAGTVMLPRDERPGSLLVAAAVTHCAISLGWAPVVTLVLPRRHPVLGGAAAGLAIAAFELGVVGRRIDRIRRLLSVPQVADHVAHGIAVGVVIARGRG